MLRTAAVSLFHKRKLAFPPSSNPLRWNHVGSIHWQEQKSINAQISYFMRNGLVEQAEKLFDDSPHRNTVTYNAMIRGYFQNDSFDEALCLFDRMPSRDIFSYNTVIAGLMQYGDAARAEWTFRQMPIKDVVSWNSMIVGCVHNSLLDDALALFDEMPVRNVISWNIIIAGFMKSGRFDEAEKLFDEMPAHDVVSWTAMISGLAEQGRIVEARQFFDEMPERDVCTWNTMLNGYIKNGKSEITGSLFVKMPEKDVDSWNEIIDGVLGCGRLDDALRYITEMPQQGLHPWNTYLLGLIRIGLVHEAHAFFQKIPFKDTITWTNLVVGYFGLGEVDAACKLFHMTPGKDETLWNVAIFGLGDNDYGEEGLKHFLRMGREQWKPDHATFTSVLDICSNLPSLDFGKQTHGQIIKMGFDCFVAVCSAVITMYAKCGSVTSAVTGFTCIKYPDIICWNSIICGLSHHGRGRDALNLFHSMSSTDIKPNEITFIGVLSACSHTGFVDQGLYYFGYMKYKCYLQPTGEHYTCMVDMLGRSGFLEEAANFIEHMRLDGIEPSGSIWGALLGACRIDGNVVVGEMAGLQLLEIEPQNAGAYVIMAELYLGSGRRKDAEKIWALMKDREVKKQPGCSWIEVQNMVHVFLAGDNLHPEISEIFEMLRLMEQQNGNEET